MTKTKRPARSVSPRLDPVERARAEAAQIETPAVSPELAAMVTEFVSLGRRLSVVANHAEEAKLYWANIGMYEGITAFKVQSVADLCAKLPIFREERDIAEDGEDPVGARTWNALVRDLEHIAEMHGLTEKTPKPRSSTWLLSNRAAS